LPNILAGELLNGDEYKEYIYTDLYSKKDAEGTILRRKRLYPLHQRGIQHKDTMYTR